MTIKNDEKSTSASCVVRKIAKTNPQIDNKNLGIYIHIPYCKSKCYYCDFVSKAGDTASQKLYVAKLIEEIKACEISPSDCGQVDTLYFGGGTPSLLYSGAIAQIVSALKAKFNFSRRTANCGELSDNLTEASEENAAERLESVTGSEENAVCSLEFTVECNPETITKEKLTELKSAGVNRISLGVQSFHDNLLKAVNRTHSSESVFNAVHLIRKHGFTNYSFDLMMGLPGQTLDMFKLDIEEAVKLAPSHLSLYSLKVEDNTVLSRRGYEANDDLMVEMYDYARRVLSAEYDYTRYEVSNFCKAGCESRHNLKYWRRDNYIGFGVSAHSFVEPNRWENTSNISKYIVGDFGRVSSVIGEDEAKLEFVMLGLRLGNGFSLSEYQRIFREDFRLVKANQIKYLLQMGAIRISDDRIYIADEYFYVMNDIICKLT